MVLLHYWVVCKKLISMGEGLALLRLEEGERERKREFCFNGATIFSKMSHQEDGCTRKSASDKSHTNARIYSHWQRAEMIKV